MRQRQRTRLYKLVEQRLGLSQISHGEPLGEPAVNRRKESLCLSTSALIAPESSETGGGAQF